MKRRTWFLREHREVVLVRAKPEREQQWTYHLPLGHQDTSRSSSRWLLRTKMWCEVAAWLRRTCNCIFRRIIMSNKYNALMKPLLYLRWTFTSEEGMLESVDGDQLQTEVTKIRYLLLPRNQVSGYWKARNFFNLMIQTSSNVSFRTRDGYIGAESFRDHKT
jgi:hypothetical protein